MKASIIKIGNSSGVRIPKPLLELCAFEKEVDLVVEEGRLVITPVRSVRDGWDSAFADVAASGDDRPLIDDSIDDTEEWQW